MKSSGGYGVSDEKNAFEQLLSEVEIPEFGTIQAGQTVAITAGAKLPVVMPRMIWLCVFACTHVYDVMPAETDGLYG